MRTTLRLLLLLVGAAVLVIGKQDWAVALATFYLWTAGIISLMAGIAMTINRSWFEQIGTFAVEIVVAFVVCLSCLVAGYYWLAGLWSFLMFLFLHLNNG